MSNPTPKHKFQKGNPGRKKGSPNKLTETAKRILADVLEGREEEFNTVLDELRTKRPADYASIYTELLKKALPKKLEVSGLNITVPEIDYSKLTDDELRTLAELQSKSRVSTKTSD